MALLRVLPPLVLLIMTSAPYVEGIRNTARKDTHDGSTQSKLLTTSEQSTSFQPSELLDFTASDAGLSSSGNQASHSRPFQVPDPEYSQPERHSPDAKFAFPPKQQRQSVPATLDNYIGSNNYNVPSSGRLPNEITTQLPSTPIRTYRDPYTDENVPSSPSDVQEYTVHSTMQVQNPKAPAYQRATPGTPPYFAPQASQFAYKHDSHSHSHSLSHPPNPHPNALPTSTSQLFRPSAARPTPPRLSYASQDYLSPSHFHPNQAPPQRQDVPQPASPPSAASNYANNYSGDYLQGERYEYQHQHQHQHQHQKPPDSYYAQPPYSHFGARPHHATSSGGATRPAQSLGHNTNFFTYQQGESPPSLAQSYRPPPPSRPVAELPQQSGLASLASLLSSTQQYAPQVSQLGSLLGLFSGTSGASASSSAPPMNTQLIKALENIARNDDLQCVPNVLCQLIAGQTQRGQLPTFLTSPAITSFLASFPASSPVLIFGRAALLGISGGAPSCVQTYARCPKSEDEILFYLNNHRGGFFKLFSEPEQTSLEPQNSPSTPSSGSSSFFSILSLLTGSPPATTAPPPPPPPKPRPTKAAADISSSIGNFFSNVLSGYVGKVEHQRRGRRARRALDADDDEKSISPVTEQEAHAENGSNKAQYVAESRILHKDLAAMDSRGPTFFPRNKRLELSQKKSDRKLKFPASATGGVKNTSPQISLVDEDHTFLSVGQLSHPSNGFKQEQANGDDQSEAHTDVASIVVTDPRRGVRMIYTGSLEEFRRGRILNRPSYAVTHNDFFGGGDDRDRLVVSVKRRPHHATGSSATNYNAQRGTTDLHHYGRPQPQGHNCNDAYSQNNNSPHNYRNANDDCVDNNRYVPSGDSNRSQRTTQRPREDDKNIYVTNSKGLNEYYITPDGKRVYF